MNRLLKFASFFWDIPVEQSGSEQNNYLEVVYTNGKKMLNTKNANFSFGNGYKVFQIACAQIDSEIKAAHNVLILGFGCGSINEILRNQHNYQNQIDGIEYDKKIIDLFWKHFAVNNDKLDIALEDAYVFLEKNQKEYDIVFVDLFEELNNVDFVFKSAFLNNIIKINPKAIVFNLTSQSKKDREAISELVLNLSTKFKDVKNTSFQDLNQIIVAK